MRLGPPREAVPAPPRAPATRYARTFDRALCAADVPEAMSIYDHVRRSDPSIEGWVNFPLFNRTGDANDTGLAPYRGAPRPTVHAARLPAIARIVKTLGDAGLVMNFGRVAVLGGRDMLRPHVDTFPNRRVLIPLTEQGDNFRHLYGDTCFVMRAGEVWGGDGTSCHGAANVSASGYRVLLLLDVAPDVAEASTPVWFRAPWEVPDEARVFRPSLPRAARHARYETARGLARGGGHNAAEREILLLAFEFDMPAEHAYRELLCFARWMGRSEGPDGEWRGRARALLNPTLPFAVAVPGRTTRRTARAGAAVA